MFSVHKKHIIYYLVSPFFLLLLNLGNYKSKFFPGILYLFCLFYGFTFTVASDAFDGARVISKFTEANNFSFLNFTGISEIVSTGNTQIIESIIIWFVANSFESTQVLFLVYASIFGYFYAKNFQIISSLFTLKNSKFEIILLITFILIIPIWEINGFRMWTASHIFFFSTFNLFFKRIDVKNIFFLLLTPFFHFSFWILIVPVLVYVFFKRILKTKILFLVFTITLFLNPIQIDKRNAENTINSEYAVEKMKGYGNKSYMKDSQTKLNKQVLYAKYYKTALHIGLIVPFILLVLRFDTENKKFKNFLNWTLFLGIFVNIVSLLPFADMLRFRLIHYLFIIFCTIFILKNDNNSKIKLNTLKNIKVFLVILLVVFNLVELRKGLDRFGIYTVLTNPLTVLFFPKENNEALINLIK